MTSSSVRWSKTETSRLNTEEHDFKTNFRRSKNHQKFDLSACSMPTLARLRSFRRTFPRIISIREDIVQSPMMLRISSTGNVVLN
ncbi:unnamed protein product [Lactuca virosa]|uniref:Uncharacterized protein n=1 Tax=Lactuca virosa TaxID=75947 RepID=A0AAU9N6C6_9ASTR|nr:unnamed protein product [Lactuca virosa]